MFRQLTTSIFITTGKTIHVLNKNEHALELATPLHDDDGNLVGENSGAAIVQGRSNVLLLGDHLGDLGMSDGVDYENRISVGFLSVSFLLTTFRVSLSCYNSGRTHEN